MFSLVKCILVVVVDGCLESVNVLLGDHLLLLEKKSIGLGHHVIVATYPTIHLGLGETRLIYFIMSIFSITIEVNHNIFLILVPETHSKGGHIDYTLYMISIHM